MTTAGAPAVTSGVTGLPGPDGRSHDDGVAEFLDLARVKPSTLGAPG